MNGGCRRTVVGCWNWRDSIHGNCREPRRSFFLWMQSARTGHPLNFFPCLESPGSCRAPHLTSSHLALLSEVAEVVALPDLCSEVPQDPVCNRDVEEEVGQHQVPNGVVAAEPPAHDRRLPTKPGSPIPA